MEIYICFPIVFRRRDQGGERLSSPHLARDISNHLFSILEILHIFYVLVPVFSLLVFSPPIPEYASISNSISSTLKSDQSKSCNHNCQYLVAINCAPFASKLCLGNVLLHYVAASSSSLYRLFGWRLAPMALWSLPHCLISSLARAQTGGSSFLSAYQVLLS